MVEGNNNTFNTNTYTMLNVILTSPCYYRPADDIADYNSYCLLVITYYRMVSLLQYRTAVVPSISEFKSW